MMEFGAASKAVDIAFVVVIVYKHRRVTGDHIVGVVVGNGEAEAVRVRTWPMLFSLVAASRPA
jgi:hypothetical protein